MMNGTVSAGNRNALIVSVAEFRQTGIKLVKSGGGPYIDIIAADFGKLTHRSAFGPPVTAGMGIDNDSGHGMNS
jgi:hypothetical protein